MTRAMVRFQCLLTVCCILLSQGCVARRPAAVHQTLKGDNSTVQAMQGEMELPESGFMTLSDLTDQFAADLARAVAVRNVYLDRANIRDAITRDVAHFSTYLENELDASLSEAFRLVSNPAEADYLIGAVFQQYGNGIKIFFKYHKQDMTERRSLDYTIEQVRLPADSLKENLNSKAYQLAVNIIPETDGLQLYINPVRLDTCGCVTDFSRSFTRMVRTEVLRLHPDVQVKTEKPIVAGGLRGIKNKAREVKDLAAADAVFAGADTVLEGDYSVDGGVVRVDLALKDLSGELINAASVDIDRSLIGSRLDNPEKELLAEKADKQTESSGNELAITTTEGSGDPVYREGEKITFLVQVKRPLYVYIYDIASSGEVALIYPYETGAAQHPSFPGRVQAIPDEADNFELEVTPPFGMDIVKVFASPLQLPLPQLSDKITSRGFTGGVRALSAKRKEIQQQLATESTINPDDLVDYYRGLATQFGIEVYEDSLIVETRRR